MMKHLVKALLCTGVLAGCSGSGDGSSGPQVIQTGECSIVDQNQELIDYLQDKYYWYQDMPSNLNAASFESPYHVLEAARVPQDRFSFIMTEDEYAAAFTNANMVGYGFSYRIASDSQSLLIRYVFDNGAAHDAGMTRGDEIIAINGVPVATLASQVASGSNSWSNIFGEATEGISGHYSWQRPNGEIIDADMVKTVVDTNTVLHHEVVGSFDKQIGYMVFNSFIERSRADLNLAFDEFAGAGVNEMILDLRYNGGGLVSVANQLATQIGGTNVEGNTFVNLVYNDKNPQSNTTTLFDLGEGVAQLDLDRVIVLSTEATCSASELVINSLSPFIDVVVVGDNTCGKPIGMNPVQICDKVIFAINFETTNHLDQGGYFDGLPEHCFASDQIVADWGDIADPLLQEGLYYINNQQCFSVNKSLDKPVKKQQTSPIDWRNGPFAGHNLI